MTSPITTPLPNGLAAVEQDIARACKEARRDRASVTLIAVSKTFDADAIAPVIDAGQRVFGENRVQEAKAKWPELMSAYPGIALHLIGPLQSNKAKEAVALFDAIHSVDRPSICEALAKEINSQKQAAGIVRSAQHRRGAAEGRRRARRSRRLHCELPRQIWSVDFRADVHSAGRRGAGAAFRADREDRRAQWAEKSVDGHERRFRDRDPVRRHPCAGRLGDFRASVKALLHVCEPAKRSIYPRAGGEIALLRSRRRAREPIEAHRHLAERPEIGGEEIAGLDRQRRMAGAGRDDLAGPQRYAELAQFVGKPRQRDPGIAEHVLAVADIAGRAA